MKPFRHDGQHEVWNDPSTINPPSLNRRETAQAQTRGEPCGDHQQGDVVERAAIAANAASGFTLGA
jgi:hypothetical protein